MFVVDVVCEDAVSLHSSSTLSTTITMSHTASFDFSLSINQEFTHLSCTFTATIQRKALWSTQGKQSKPCIVNLLPLVRQFYYPTTTSTATVHKSTNVAQWDGNNEYIWGNGNIKDSATTHATITPRENLDSTTNITGVNTDGQSAEPMAWLQSHWYYPVAALAVVAGVFLVFFVKKIQAQRFVNEEPLKDFLPGPEFQYRES
eukprot:m.89439 g.89439  ORF g.89439 m.89439 type:complete len:203 (+) comp13220_c0_seq2:202-810(+)